MQELLKEVFRTYYKDVYMYLYSLSRNASLSEDLASDVFLEVVKSIAKFRGESDIKTWLFAIARYQWFSHLRQEKRRANIKPLSEFYNLQEQSAEEHYQHQALLQQIHIWLAEEPERTRSIFLMRAQGFSFYEIGQKHGISENSARVIDFRVKAKMRKKLKEEGFAND